MITCVSPSNFIHVSSNSSSEFGLDTPHYNIENVFLAFPTLFEVYVTMMDDFDKLMNESAPRSNESSLENPSHVVTMTSPVVTTTTKDSINLSQDVVAGENDDSSLPPLLVSNTPKRKKRAVSPEDFDFTQLVPVKPKTIKKAETLSRVKLDKNKKKYVEVVIPPSDAIIGQV